MESSGLPGNFLKSMDGKEPMCSKSNQGKADSICDPLIRTKKMSAVKIRNMQTYCTQRVDGATRLVQGDINLKSHDLK